MTTDQGNANELVKLPSDIRLHKKSKQLELIYSDRERYLLSCEYLRVHSPSAEVRGHGPGQEVLQTGKLHVNIIRIEPVGNYAIQLHFTDGHESGIYSWAYLYSLCTRQEENWRAYLQKMREAGANRDPDVQVVRIGN